MREVDFDTFFVSSKLITLDSVYFQAGSRVQCAARAVNSNGDEGLELSSPIVSISMDKGECSSLLWLEIFRLLNENGSAFKASGRVMISSCST